jgi:3'-phosphoadenosine 5'-phosphosulfate sulfotransferase (PAPS reductase)/FAD synthetase
MDHKEDYSNKKVLIGLSGGINSMALLCHLSDYPEYYRPKEIHLFYAHFKEHSPDTLGFVLSGVEYAKRIFKNVTYIQTDNSVLEFFKEQKMIPHPMIAPCTRILKIIPMAKYMVDNDIDIDLVGYVKEEARRIANMRKKNESNFNTKQFPISSESNEWCFDIVKKEIGWYPKIYDLKWNDAEFISYTTENLYRLPDDVQKRITKKMGKDKRVFTHNNCLPCKNMQLDEMLAVEFFYRDYWNAASNLSEELQKHWGRQKNEFYTTFGRQDHETNYQKQSCGVCALD